MDEKGKVRIKSGDEVDAFHRHHHHNRSWRAGARARIKRGYARRNRRAARVALTTNPILDY